MSNNIKFNLIMRFLELVKKQSKWDIKTLCNILDIEINELEYIVNTLSEMYISTNYDVLLDIEISDEELSIEFNSVFEEPHLITDLELISVYKLLLEAKSDFLDNYIDTENLNIFLKTLSDYISLDMEDEETFDGDSFLDDEELIIDYSPTGYSSSFKYHVKPLSLVKNNEGVALLAFDVKENKLKTFLIQRIYDISKEIIDFSNIERDDKEIQYEIKFQFINKKTSLYGISDKLINEYEKNHYSVSFINRSTALESVKKNIFNIKVINDDDLNAEINSSLNKVINLIDK